MFAYWSARVGTPSDSASGAEKVERALRARRNLPPGFASNPAQAFFALQRREAERRRRVATDDGQISPDDAVRLAA